MQSNKVVIITGSTRGIGYGLAEAFLERGCAVVVSGRTPESSAAAAARLARTSAAERVYAQACDVTVYAQVQDLWDSAVARFERIDIWINNAGLAHPQKKVWELPSETMQALVDTNLLGTMYGSRVAVQGMLRQGFGTLYNMEGAGSNGRRIHGLGVYGSTKYGLRYLTQSLADEVEGTAVNVCALSPGMVVTDLLTGQNQDSTPAERERAKNAFNLLADRVETVAPWLVDRMLADPKNGMRIAWLTPGKIIGRLALGRFRKRKLVE